VFSQFVDHSASCARPWTPRRDLPVPRRQHPVRKRTAAVKAFQAGEGELFLISLKAGGTGLNLTAADYIIHMDPWWNPAVEDQASDRAHRIGQTRPVTVYRLVLKGTVEQKILGLHRHKRQLATTSSAKAPWPPASTPDPARSAEGGLAGDAFGSPGTRTGRPRRINKPFNSYLVRFQVLG